MQSSTHALTTSGVPGLGEISWGTHFCHFYEHSHDLVDTLVPFFKAGLDHNEACLWVTAQPLPSGAAREALCSVVPDLDRREANGQIEIIDHAEWYRRSVGQTATQTLEGWIEREQRALAGGYKGLRLTGNTYWLERSDWASFVEYESLVSEAFHGRQIVGLCSYCLNRCTPSDMLDVIRNHQFTVARRGDKWEVLESAALQSARNDLLNVQKAMAREHEVAKRLREAEASLRESAQRKDDFLAMLGHELRNPLAPISTALQLLRLRDADKEFRREFDVVERQVDHLTSLVNDLLDVSRITRGKLELKRERMELTDAIAAGIEIASPLLEQAQQVLRIEVPDEGLPMVGDKKRIAQIISNLLTNAAKNSPEHSEIVVSAYREAENVLLQVRDHGRGIAQDLLPKIFELFVQSGQGIERSAGGLGLGLAIVRSLVELHGGKVQVSSSVGAGSEFTVCLPAFAELPVVSEAPAGLPAAGLGLGDCRVLIVDDNVDAVHMLAELIAALGCEVRTATDAPSALMQTKDFAPDVALLDIGLPVIDGYELGRQLRQEFPTLRLCAITGYGQSSDRQRSREAGFESHLVKPVSFQQLQDFFRSVPCAHESESE